MDPKYAGETLRYLEKQEELLMDSYRSMSHELRKLQVEEEMLMRTFFDVMAAQGLNKKKQGDSNVSVESEIPQSLVTVHSQEPLQSLVIVDSQEPLQSLVAVDSEEEH